MSLPEIIPSNLPVFVQNKNRSAFANSVIPSGAVLLFAESDDQGGSKLIAKNPDGSFSEVGGGSSMNFYKCASVGTGTWTGYLASVDPVTGVWSFASTATTGLTYDRITPVVGNVYDEECTFIVSRYNTGLPENGLILYLPLQNSIDTEITGQTTTASGTPKFSIYQGVPCAEFDKTWYIDIQDQITGITGNNPFTICFWAARAYGGDADTNNFGPSNGDSNISGQINSVFYYSGGWIGTNTTAPINFSFFRISFTGTSLSMYINEIQQGSSASTSNPGSLTQLSIGRALSQNLDGYMTAFRIYNRVLDASEIADLAAEFTPTAS